MLKFCSNCVMDGSDPDITFDNGVCNHCQNAQRELKMAEAERPNLSRVIEKIKKDGKRDYDILIGLSGGVDSSLVLYRAVELGLRPLCFSIDNGWQTPEAQENIMRLVEGMKVPFYRYNINLDRFKELQAAFMKAGLINLEIPTDHILMASSLEMAAKYNIKWIVSGGNVATESIMPHSWSYPARDLIHIKDVYKKMTGKNLKGLPLCGLLKWNYYKWIKGIKTLYLLDFLVYNRAKSIELLKKEYGYHEYGLKHEENTFTSWFQNFYLFQKFGIDKRKCHYSSMINSGQMTKKEALLVITDRPEYPALGIEAKVLKYPKRKHEDFAVDKWFGRISKLIRFLYKHGIIKRISNNVV